MWLWKSSNSELHFLEALMVSEHLLMCFPSFLGRMWEYKLTVQWCTLGLKLLNLRSWYELCLAKNLWNCQTWVLSTLLVCPYYYLYLLLSKRLKLDLSKYVKDSSKRWFAFMCLLPSYLSPPQHLLGWAKSLPSQARAAILGHLHVHEVERGHTAGWQMEMLSITLSCTPWS